MSHRIHLVSEHASPLALLGGVDAGGQNVHVAALATGLARQGAEVVVHTRRDDPSLERTVPFAPGVVVDHVDAGPPVPIPKDELLPYMGEFAESDRNAATGPGSAAQAVASAEDGRAPKATADIALEKGAAGLK